MSKLYKTLTKQIVEIKSRELGQFMLAKEDWNQVAKDLKTKASVSAIEDEKKEIKRIEELFENFLIVMVMICNIKF
jgi:hypothetical protein